MTIYKHIHSCVIVENRNKTILIDPGRYDYADYPLDFKKIPTLNYLLITHKHGDHLYLPFIKSIVNAFPSITIISNSEVKEKLEKESLSVSLEKNEFIALKTRKHEQSFDKGAPLNTIFTLFDRFTHSGDNIEYIKRSEIMTLPIDCGMWGKVSNAVEKLVQLKPKFILPIHDYRLKDEIQDEVFIRIESYFKNFNITFLPLKPGESTTL